mmetsp:Transcript_54384/g.137365  ORF Transcript_54384/g.137365 Transcript_54384/m.137365 type:complete len:141 (-) Transcript_54384:998-1420(-)
MSHGGSPESSALNFPNQVSRLVWQLHEIMVQSLPAAPVVPQSLSRMQCHGEVLLVYEDKVCRVVREDPAPGSKHIYSEEVKKTLSPHEMHYKVSSQRVQQWSDCQQTLSHNAVCVPKHASLEKGSIPSRAPNTPPDAALL